MKNKKFYFAVTLGVPFQFGQAAALEQMDQNISAFLEPKNYAEINLAMIDAKVDGEVQYKEYIAELGIQNFSTGNLVQREYTTKFALKFQPHAQISTGLIYEQPFKTDVSYVYSPSLADGSRIEIEAADINFSTHNLTGLLGYQPNKNWNFYTGLSAQSFKGNLKVSGQQYDALNGYDVHFKNDNSLGWLAGLSYQYPEYAIKTSLTYRSKITHKNKTSESTLYSNGPITLSPEFHTTFETPQSVNLELQTAVSSKNIAYGSVRWVNWQDFVIQPPQLSAVLHYASLDPRYAELAKLKLIEYKKDQWSGKIGFAHQWNPSLLTGLEFVWDNGTGNPASTLNPSDGYRGIGLGNMFRFNADTFIASGLYYLKFSKPSIPASPSAAQISGLSSVDDNDAFIYGLKIGHHF